MIFEKEKYVHWGSRNERDDLIKSDDFQKKTFEFSLPFGMVTTFSEQWPSSSHRKMGGRFGEKCRFPERKIEFGLPV